MLFCPLVFASNHLELVCLKFDSIPSFATRFEEGVEMTERVGTPEYSKCGAVFLMFPSSVLLILAFSTLYQWLLKLPGDLTLVQSVMFGQVRR